MGADGSVKPTGMLLQQAGLGAPQSDVPSDSSLLCDLEGDKYFMLWSCSAWVCAVQFASVMHQELLYGEGEMRRVLDFSPKDMTSKASAKFKISDLVPLFPVTSAG